MPAGLPGSSLTDNLANPNKGTTVTLDPLSGPKGSPLDAKVITGWTAVAPSGAGGMPTLAAATGESSVSTGALCTGIGFDLSLESPLGLDGVVGTGSTPVDLDNTGNFSSQYIPGTSLPSLAAAPDARLLYIGGGKSDALGVSTPRAVSQICNGGGGTYIGPVVGASRDAGAGQGFGGKIVIATADTAFGAAIVAGFLNRMASGDGDFTGEPTGIALKSGQAQMGSATVAAPIPS